MMFHQTVLGGFLPLAAPVFLALCLAVSAIGFRKLVYFISIGYGYSIAAMALVSLGAGALAGRLEAIAFIEAALLAAYGLRLGTYLVLREGKAAYQATQAEDGDRSEGAGLGLKLAVWPVVSLLYVAMFEPCTARFVAAAEGRADPVPVLSAIGLALMGLGLALEALADRQKSAAKKLNPRRFCDSGLYRLVRCPNYLGETIFWTGNLLAGVVLLGSWLAWLLSITGLVSIVLIMKGSARRLEIKQGERYGSDPDYQAYVRRVPILLPFVPIYSFRNSKFHLG
jgi:steroid 5-alpha reductase family enzyme